MSSNNRTTRNTAIAQLLSGFQKHWDLGGLHLNSETLEPKEVTASLRAVIEAGARVAEARGALAAALHDEEAVLAEKADVITCLKQVVTNAFKNKPDVLADFGLGPRARKQLTVKEKLDAVTKQLATRDARGTKGKRQKAAIHGAPVATHATEAPAAPTVPPTPIAPPTPALNGHVGATSNGGG